MRRVCSNAEVVHTGVQEVFWKNRRSKQQHPAALGKFVVVEDLRAVDEEFRVSFILEFECDKFWNFF